MNKLRLRPKNGDPVKEVQAIEDEYLLLTIEFEAKLFQSEHDESVSYTDLFKEYSLRWYEWCMGAMAKFRHVHPDKNMFYMEYHPVA
jgi:hypothetical protein